MDGFEKRELKYYKKIAKQKEQEDKFNDDIQSFSLHYFWL